MKKLFKIADDYIATMKWEYIALLKVCMLSIGVLLGTLFVKRNKRAVAITSLGVFAVSYVSLMGNFVSFLLKRREKDEDEEIFMDYIPE